MKKSFIVLITISFITMGCQTTGGGQKQSVGTLLGAIGGGLAGSQLGSGKGQLVGVAAGTLLGAFLGSEVGASLDRADAIYANQTANRAFEFNAADETSNWENPETGNSGSVTPTTQSYQVTNGQYCRQYEQEIFVEGQKQIATGTACRNEYGEWVIQ